MTWQEGSKPGVVKKHLKPLRINSKMPIGMYKGHSIKSVIDNDPKYLSYMSKRHYIRLTSSVRTLLQWALHEPKKTVDTDYKLE